MKVLVLDKDTDYSKRLSYYFEKKYHHVQIAISDNIDDAKRMMAEDYFDVVLFDSFFDTVNLEEIKSLLDRSSFAYISETNEIINDCDTVEKYTGISVIYKKICNLYEKKKNRVIKTDDSDGVTGRKTEIITFLPVHGGCGSSTMAAACAASLARTAKVLYVNLEQCPSDEVFFETDGKKTVTDIISTLKSKYTETGLGKTIKEVITEGTVNGGSRVSCIRGYANIMDSLSMTEQCMGALLSAFSGKLDYRYIIIDADFIVSKVLGKLISMSDRVVFVAVGSAVSNVKLSKLQRYLDILKRSTEGEMPSKHLLLNMYKNTNNEMSDIRDMDILGRVANYRPSDGNSTISPREVIYQMLAGKDVFEGFRAAAPAEAASVK